MSHLVRDMGFATSRKVITHKQNRQRDRDQMTTVHCRFIDLAKWEKLHSSEYESDSSRALRSSRSFRLRHLAEHAALPGGSGLSPHTGQSLTRLFGISVSMGSNSVGPTCAGIAWSVSSGASPVCTVHTKRLSRACSPHTSRRLIRWLVAKRGGRSCARLRFFGPVCSSCDRRHDRLISLVPVFLCPPIDRQHIQKRKSRLLFFV